MQDFTLGFLMKWDWRVLAIEYRSIINIKSSRVTFGSREESGAKVLSKVRLLNIFEFSFIFLSNVDFTF